MEILQLESSLSLVLWKASEAPLALLACLDQGVHTVQRELISSAWEPRCVGWQMTNGTSLREGGALGSSIS